MRPTFLNRRAAMIAAVGATLTLAACGGGGTAAPAEGDMAKGAGEDAAAASGQGQGRADGGDHRGAAVQEGRTHGRLLSQMNSA